MNKARVKGELAYHNTSRLLGFQNNPQEQEEEEVSLLLTPLEYEMKMRGNDKVQGF